MSDTEDKKKGASKAATANAKERITSLCQSRSIRQQSSSFTQEKVWNCSQGGLFSMMMDKRYTRGIRKNEPAAAPKKRGRPAAEKKEAPPKELKPEEVDHEEPEEEEEEEDEPSPPKRGRGRPKKGTTSAPAPKKVPSGRGRGRPPKNKGKAAAASETNGDASD